METGQGRCNIVNTQKNFHYILDRTVPQSDVKKHLGSVLNIAEGRLRHDSNMATWSNKAEVHLLPRGCEACELNALSLSSALHTLLCDLM